MELVCPAGNFQSLKAAIENGADAIYLGLRDDTNAHHFPGLTFHSGNLAEAVGFAHAHRRKIFLAINTYPRAEWLATLASLAEGSQTTFGAYARTWQ